MSPRSALAAAAALCLALLTACGVVPPSRPPVDILVEKEVADFKIGLRSPESPEPLRLDERMDQLGVGVVSIALVNEGELRWARSFGERAAPPAPQADEDESKSEETRSGVFPTPSAEDPVTEYAAAVDVGGLIDVPRGFLAARTEDGDPSSAEALDDEIFAPLEMTDTYVEDGRLYSTAEDLAQIVTDLQKAHAGKPARRLRQEQAQALFGTLRSEAGGSPAIDLGLKMDGEGQAVHFERRAATDTHLVVLAGFVYSGHGAVVIADDPGAGPLVDEILAGLAELYDWPAYRVEPADETDPDSPDSPAPQG